MGSGAKQKGALSLLRTALHYLNAWNRLENGISGKHIIVLYLQLLNTKIYPLQYLSLGFILKILRISALIFL